MSIFTGIVRGVGGFGFGAAGGWDGTFDGFNTDPAPFSVTGASVTLTSSIWTSAPNTGESQTITNNGGGRYVEISVRGFGSGAAGGRAGGKYYLEKNSTTYIRHAGGGSGSQSGASGLVLITTNSLPTSAPDYNVQTLLVGGGSGGGTPCPGIGGTGGGSGGGTDSGSPGFGAGGGGGQNGGGAGGWSPQGTGNAGTKWYGGAANSGGSCQSGGGGGGWYGGGGGGKDFGAGGWGGGGGGSGYYVTHAPRINSSSLTVTLRDDYGNVKDIEDTEGNGVFAHGTMLTGSGTFSPSAPNPGNGQVWLRIAS